MKLQTRDIMIGLGLICLSALFAFSEDPFFDNFDRRNGKPGNDWIVNSPEVKTEIKDNEILIHGTEKTNWKRNGIERLIDDINKICFDFLNNDVFNVHLRVDDDKSGTNAYIDIYSPPGPQEGKNFNYASPADGAWLVGLISVGPRLKRILGKRDIVSPVYEKNKRIFSSS